jgi:hypothetical protein
MQPANVLKTEFPSLAEPTPAFLVACLRSRWRPEALEQAHALAAAPAFDWAAVDEVARCELLAPLLYRILQGRGILPAGLEDAWRGLYAGSLRRNLLLLGELDDVLQALEPAASAPILLKGAALLRTVYDDAGMRPMNDIDLLLRQLDVPAALRLLAGLGYAVDQPFTYWGEVAAHRQGRFLADVDLHWSLIGLPHYLSIIPPGWPWASARPATGGGAPALVLSPEAHR